MSSARDRDRLKLAGTIAPQQATAPFEAEALEQENVGRSNSLHARSPAVSSEDARRETASRDQGFIRAAFWNISENFGRFYRRFVALLPPPIILTDTSTIGDGGST
jgi:hypothetical protein